jgi:hypothetical protein
MQERQKSRQASIRGGVQTRLRKGTHTPEFALTPARLYNQPTAAQQTTLPGLESTAQKS